MAGARFDILFTGEVMAGADPNAVRARIQELFKLSDEAAERLFDGRPVTIKRGVATATASRYREVFRDAGALVHVTPVPTAGAPAHETAPAATDRTGDMPGHPAAVVSRLSLAPMGDDPLEPPIATASPHIDVRHLALVPGWDWTLADCEPPLPPVELPDISHLHLVEPERTQPEVGEGEH